jgi:hypothetical protein
MLRLNPARNNFQIQQWVCTFRQPMASYTAVTASYIFILEFAGSIEPVDLHLGRAVISIQRCLS